jgi:hypothetical protein
MRVLIRREGPVMFEQMIKCENLLWKRNSSIKLPVIVYRRINNHFIEAFLQQSEIFAAKSDSSDSQFDFSPEGGRRG